MSSRILKSAITAVVLAGGRARRMGGEDKGLLVHDGKPLIRHVLDSLVKQADELMINANRNKDQYGQFGYDVIADEHKDYSGPLAGMLAGLKAAKTSRVVFVPCDSPQLPSDLIERLTVPWTRDPRTKIKITVASCDRRLQPVFALLHTDLVEELETFLDDGGRKIDQFYWDQGFAEIPFLDEREFVNINTPEELQC